MSHFNFGIFHPANSPKLITFGIFMNFCQLKMYFSSLRSHCQMRLFLSFSNTVLNVNCFALHAIIMRAKVKTHNSPHVGSWRLLLGILGGEDLGSPSDDHLSLLVLSSMTTVLHGRYMI